MDTFLGTQGVARDITERKQMEEEREKLQNQLTQAQKMETVGRLAGGVAHDFNNMLNVILGYSAMLQSEIEHDKPYVAYINEIQNAAKRSADLTRQLLAFARKQTVAPKVLDINDTIAGMLKMIQRLIGEDIELAWKPGKDPWPVKVDPSQIDQILANLCVNARDAIAGVGKVIIETDNAAFDEAYCSIHTGFLPGEYVLFAVSDNGRGMDAETLSHIFEPFFTTKETGKGTGLGLATVYGVVKQNNGFVNVYSEPGFGTTFKIYLPRHADRALQKTEELRPKTSARGSETILLVEDEQAILKMTTKLLEKMGYSVISASTPGEAIRLAKEHPGRIDLLMTDVVMPEMNGRDLARNLLSIYPDIKRLFMSGYTANVIAHHGVLDEGVHFIQKPFSMDDLAVKLREALENA
jgi:nitrogen-specific signal transduction histidine kinase/CheY-like chemotaxis protein